MGSECCCSFYMLCLFTLTFKVHLLSAWTIVSDDYIVCVVWSFCLIVCLYMSGWSLSIDVTIIDGFVICVRYTRNGVWPFQSPTSQVVCYLLRGVKQRIGHWREGWVLQLICVIFIIFLWCYVWLKEQRE